MIIIISLWKYYRLLPFFLTKNAFFTLKNAFRLPIKFITLVFFPPNLRNWLTESIYAFFSFLLTLSYWISMMDLFLASLPPLLLSILPHNIPFGSVTVRFCLAKNKFFWVSFPGWENAITIIIVRKVTVYKINKLNFLRKCQIYEIDDDEQNFRYKR